MLPELAKGFRLKQNIKRGRVFNRALEYFVIGYGSELL